MQLLKKLRKAINKNAECCKNELETIKRNQEKLEYSFSEIKAQ